MRLTENQINFGNERAIANLLDMLDDTDTRCRMKAIEMWITKVNPIVRPLIETKHIETIEDIKETIQQVYSQLATGLINKEESEALLKVLNTLKETMFETKYLADIVDFKQKAQQEVQSSGK